MTTYSLIPKKLLITLGILTLLLGCLYGQFAGGSGTLADPYQIRTPEHLNAVRNYPSSHFAQIGDIDMTAYQSVGGAGYNNGSGWVPIGTESVELRFYGTYSGNGYQIRNLRINRTSQEHYIGLFGFLGQNSGLRDIGLINAQVSGGMQVGALVGGMELGVVQDCYAEGSVTASGIVGLLIGNCVTGSVVSRSFSMGTVIATSGNATGGLIGALGNFAALNNSYSHANVISAGEFVGGLVGTNALYSTITDCYSMGAVQSPGLDVGGLVGKEGYEATTTNSYWDIETSGLTYSANGTGKTTAEMQQQVTYTGWDFTGLWTLHPAESYPFFPWQQLDQPSFTPEPGDFADVTNITIGHSDPSAAIYFRTSMDDSPWTDWTLYEDSDIYAMPASTLMIQTYAIRTAYMQSSISSGIYTVTTALSPLFVSPAAGTYQDPQWVTITAFEPDTSIHYSTDGSEPTQESQHYTSPILISETSTLKARAYKPGWLPSPVLIADYVIGNVDNDEDNLIDAPTALFTAYPNPFSKSANLGFFLKENSSASLTIFNGRGQKIRTIVSGDLQKGNHSFSWDGRDESGNYTANGLYFYQLQTNSCIETRKLLLMKRGR